jgi:hypothetical protein
VLTREFSHMEPTYRKKCAEIYAKSFEDVKTERGLRRTMPPSALALTLCDAKGDS